LSDRKQKGLPPGPHNPDAYGPDTGNAYAWDKRVADDTVTSERADSHDSAHGPVTDEDRASNGDYADPKYTYHSDASSAFTEDDYVKITSVFGDVRRMVLSKNFLGGEVVNIFGGSDINLIQADIKRPVVIDIFQLFAGSKIIVPSHWK